MAQLYTVNFKTKKIITRYDAKGKKIGTTEEFVEQTLHDIPANCAMSYVEKAGATMTAQYGDANPYAKRSNKGRVKFEYQHDDAPKTAAKSKRKAPAPATSKPADYADLVNTLMEKSA